MSGGTSGPRVELGLLTSLVRRIADAESNLWSQPRSQECFTGYVNMETERSNFRKPLSSSENLKIKLLLYEYLIKYNDIKRYRRVMVYSSRQYASFKSRPLYLQGNISSHLPDIPKKLILCSWLEFARCSVRFSAWTPPALTKFYRGTPLPL
jgi:hypothetical protein